MNPVRLLAGAAATSLACGGAAAQGINIPSSAARATIDAERTIRAAPEPRSMMREPAAVSSVAAELARGGIAPTGDLLQGRDPAQVAAVLRALAATAGTPAAATGGRVTDLRQGIPSAASIVDGLRRK